MAKSVINPSENSWFSTPTGVTVMGRTKKFLTYNAMINSRYPSDFAWVVDATGDPTVNEGSALYSFSKDTGTWIKVYETEAMDNDGGVAVAADWDNLDGRPLSTPAAIDDAVNSSHSHSNITILNSISGSGIDLVISSETDTASILTNKSVLFTTIQSNITALSTKIDNFELTLSSYYDKAFIDSIVTRVSTVETKLSDYQLKSEAFNGDYNTLTNKPNINLIVTNLLTWDNVTNKPTFAAVATSGRYSDLIGIPENKDVGGYTYKLVNTTDVTRLESGDWAIVAVNGGKLLIPQTPAINATIKISVLQPVGEYDSPTKLLVSEDESISFVFKGHTVTSIDIDVPQCFTMMYTDTGWWIIEKTNL